MNMDFGTNKTPTEVTKKWAVGGTYFNEIYSGVNSEWYRKSWNDFNDLESVDSKYYCTNYYDVSVNKYCAECRTSLRFLENKD